MEEDPEAVAMVEAAANEAIEAGLVISLGRAWDGKSLQIVVAKYYAWPNRDIVEAEWVDRPTALKTFAETLKDLVARARPRVAEFEASPERVAELRQLERRLASLG